jgi:hypothetical protein
LNLRPLGYEPSELPSCSTPRRLRKHMGDGPSTANRGAADPHPRSAAPRSAHPVADDFGVPATFGLTVAFGVTFVVGLAELDVDGAGVAADADTRACSAS